jgi:hypothetical protein
VVGVAAAVVADGGADAFGQRVQVLDQVLDALRLQVRVRLEGGIEVVDVGLVVLAVVDLHRLRVDVRLERVERVRQAGKLVRHGITTPCSRPGIGPGELAGARPTTTAFGGTRKGPILYCRPCSDVFSSRVRWLWRSAPVS